MLKDKEVEEIKEILDKTENPLIYYDDDCDGLCSYLLLKNYLKKGKGVVVKSLPILDVVFLRKFKETSPDFVFIVDMPLVSQEFINEINVPIIWIDHHPLVERKGVRYYNSMKWSNGHEDSTTSLCYQIVKGPLWIAMVGSVADWRIPSFKEEFLKQYPDLFNEEITNPGDGIYKTKLGELIKIFSSILKGSTTDVNKLVSVLSKIESPYEILNKETSRGKFIYKYYESINKHYDILLKEALKSVDENEKLIAFTYSGKKYSFSSELSNELIYRYPEKVVLIAREKDGEMKVSLRGGKVSLTEIAKKASEGLDGRIGGHEYAAGGNFKKKDFVIFLQRVKELI